MAYGNSYPNYELSFTMELASDWSITGGWQSILHIGDSDGQRLPSIRFRPDSNALHVMQSTDKPPQTPRPTPSPTMGKPLRLVGGSSEYEGRVEIFHNNVWGTVCDDGWGIQDANVVCQQLFGSNALSAPCCAYFGQGSGYIWMDDVSCSGNEGALSDCSFLGWGSKLLRLSYAGARNCFGFPSLRWGAKLLWFS